MVAKSVNKVAVYHAPVRKRTSIGLRHRPKNKSARRNFKRYRGQGRP